MNYDAQIETNLSRIEKIISSSKEKYGDLESPTTESFLLIARHGKDTWNTWFYKHPANRSIDFSGYDFRGTPIDFSGFTFKSNSTKDEERKIIFKKCKFGIKTSFAEAVFESDADFISCDFTETANFEKTEFKSNCYFNNTIFLSFASFYRAAFFSCGFTKCIFNVGSSFDSAKFEEMAYFSDCSLNNSYGDKDYDFYTLPFHSSFVDTQFSFGVEFYRCYFYGPATFDATKDNPSEPTLFSRPTFLGCKFYRSSSFENRIFSGGISFEKAHSEKNGEIKTEFHFAPRFHGAKFPQNTNFHGAEFHENNGEEYSRAFRTLKLAMEQLKATREEQKFFRLEMKAEHQGLPWGKRQISTLYNLFSDYGFSLWRPIVWLLALSLLFGMGYGALANACAADTECAKIAWNANTGSATDRTWATIKYTLASVSPVPGLDKMQTELRAPLFGHYGWIPITALVLEILHKIVALVMAFLFALALRNLFKMKS